MIIEDKRHKNIVTFNDLNCGAVFEFNNQLYLKISSIIPCGNETNEITANVINLGTYSLFYFLDSVKVIPLKTKLIIEK